MGDPARREQLGFSAFPLEQAAAAQYLQKLLARMPVPHGARTGFKLDEGRP
jgi:hypothetical protein